MTWRMFRFLRRIITTVLCLVLLVCGAEVGLRVYEVRSHRQLSPARAAFGVGGLIVPSWTVRQELRPFANLKVKPTGGAESHVVRINSLGMRGPEIALPKPPDIYRVLCLGDEFLFAPQTAEERLLCTLLQQQLQPQSRLHVEVLNGSMPGACPLTEYLMLRHRWSVVQPDLVLVTISDADFAEALAYQRFMRADAQGVPLACRHPSLSPKSSNNSLITWRREFRLVDLGMSWCGESWRRQTESHENPDSIHSPGSRQLPQLDSATTQRLLQSLEPLVEWCRQSYATLCVCCVSAQGKTPQHENVPRWIATINEMSERHKFLVVEVQVPAEAETSSITLRWPAAGGQRVAEQLARRIISGTAGPWQPAAPSSNSDRITPVSLESNLPRRKLR